MKLLMFSHVFYPSVGGIERMTHELATGLSARGHVVTVVTRSLNDGVEPAVPYSVVRNPKALALLNLVKKHDIVFHNNLCARYMWSHVVFRRPWAAAVHTWLDGGDGKRRLVDRVKVFILGRASAVVCVSKAVASSLPFQTRVIPNLYATNQFYQLNDVVRRPNSIAFVGRVVKPKGLRVLLNAVALLNGGQERITLDVAGDGPEMEDMRVLAESLGISALVNFHGILTGAPLNRLLNSCAVLAVPSLWEEPFGLVALEGLGAGCRVVATNRGGLPEALDGCGTLVVHNNAVALAEAIQAALNEGPDKRWDSKRAGHLSKHAPDNVIAEYEKHLTGIL